MKIHLLGALTTLIFLPGCWLYDRDEERDKAPVGEYTTTLKTAYGEREIAKTSHRMHLNSEAILRHDDGLFHPQRIKIGQYIVLEFFEKSLNPISFNNRYSRVIYVTLPLTIAAGDSFSLKPVQRKKDDLQQVLERPLPLCGLAKSPSVNTKKIP